MKTTRKQTRIATALLRCWLSPQQLPAHKRRAGEPSPWGPTRTSRAPSSSMSAIPKPIGGRSHRRKHPRAHRTSCSSSTTTPGSPPGRPTAAGSTCHARPAGEERPHLHAVAHLCALLADAVHAPDRAQPHLERHGRNHGGLQRVSRLVRPYPAASRHHRAGPAGQVATAPSGWARTTTFPSRMSPRAATARRGRSARASSASTDSSAARPTSGIRTSSRTITSSSRRPRRSRATTSPKTWPIRRSG